jgi:hypothetical protein
MSACKNVVVAKLFALLLVAAALPATARGQNHHDHDVDVEVVNTPNVKVINTPSVNVNQLPAVQLAPGTAVAVSGTPTVQVGNPIQLAPGTAVAVSGTPTVQVGNTAASPVPVHDTATPKRTPFQRSISFLLQDGDFGDIASFTVPDGKRLVIEYASCYIPSPPDHFILDIGTRDSSGTEVVYMLPVIQEFNTSDRGHSAIAGQVVKLFSEPGTEVDFQAVRTTSTGTISVFFAISGYLEDVQ